MENTDELMKLYQEYEIDKISDPHEQNKRFKALTEEWELMTGEKHKVQTIRLCINNIKRAPKRAINQAINRQKKQGMIILIFHLAIKN